MARWDVPHLRRSKEAMDASVKRAEMPLDRREARHQAPRVSAGEDLSAESAALRFERLKHQASGAETTDSTLAGRW
jgi:hypothetical protein